MANEFPLHFCRAFRRRQTKNLFQYILWKIKKIYYYKLGYERVVEQVIVRKTINNVVDSKLSYLEKHQ